MKNFLAIIFVFGFFQAFGQNKPSNISLSFENAEIKTVISKIENISDYHFYYLDEWIKGGLVSGNYKDSSIENILKDILKETDINFYISDTHQIILTKNIIIYNELPIGFFGKTEEKIVTVIEKDSLKTITSKVIDTIKKIEIVKKEKAENISVVPIFYNEDKNTKDKGTRIVRIGKESKNSKQKTYTLTGSILNKKTGIAIPNVAVIVKGKNIGTVTNSSGYYSLKIPAGLNIIETSSIATVNSIKKVIIYSNGKLDFALEETLEALDEVIVEAQVDRNIKETVTGITQIKVKEIKTIPLVLGERDILKVAVTLPGISTTGEGSSGYNVRGGKEDQNLILLDNATIYNPSHFFGIFSALNPFTTGDVTIYKGNIPAEYGGRLSSVFDISTKDANTEKFAGEVSIGPVTGNVTLEIPVVKDKSALLIGGRATYSGWILRSLDEDQLKNSEASFYDVIAKYNHIINDNNTIKTTAYYSKDRFSISSDSLYSYSNRLFSFQWNHNFNENNKGSLIIANSKYNFNIEFDGRSNTDFDLGYENNETEIKLKFRNQYSDNIAFDYGISSRLYTIFPGSVEPTGSNSAITPVDIPKERGLESALFVSSDIDINDQFSISAGARYSFYAFLGEASQKVYQEGLPRNNGTLIEVKEFDKNEVVKSYSGPEFRLSARYAFLPDLSIKASYNSTYQYIHTLSSNTTVSPTDTWKLSDLNIKPQQANQYSFGVFKNINDNMYELSIESYYKETKNILDYKVGAQLLLNEAIETEVLQGDGKSYGVEFLLKKTKGRLNGWLGYTYSKSLIKLDSDFNEERVNNGAFFPTNFDKPHDLSIVANYKLTKRFSLSANFAYQTGRPVTFPVGSYTFNNAEFVLYSDRNKFRIPDYYRLDIGFNMEGNHRIKKFAHSFWNISIYNVLGRNNPYSVFFVTQDGQLKAKQSSIFSIPIPTITYNFRF